jgi:hypothetical protein
MTMMLSPLYLFTFQKWFTMFTIPSEAVEVSQEDGRGHAL